jgi:hypothetical protein
MQPPFSGEYIWRKESEKLFPLKAAEIVAREPYPWERKSCRERITKEFFRCRGDNINPPRAIEVAGEKRMLFDCGGAESHSLPLQNGKEFIYPTLLELLSFVQHKSGGRVVITSGHRCPQHHAYISEGRGDTFSKHMVGAEVTFYVEGFEQQATAVINMLQNYFEQNPRYKGLQGYAPFQRYEKEPCGVATLPWCNKEVFIKLFLAHEGRNRDNSHPFPYIDLQLRIDRDSGARLVPSWPQANNFFHF